jgi:hypothetical protein
MPATAAVLPKCEPLPKAPRAIASGIFPYRGALGGRSM